MPFYDSYPDYLKADGCPEVPTIIGAVQSPLPPSSVVILTDNDSYEAHCRDGSSVMLHQMVFIDWNGFNRLAVVGELSSHGGGSGVNYFACAIGVLLENQITLCQSTIPSRIYTDIKNRKYTHSQLESLVKDNRIVRTVWSSGDGLSETALRLRSSDLYEWIAGRQPDILELVQLGKLTECLDNSPVIQWGALDPELAQLKNYVESASPEDDDSVIEQLMHQNADVVVSKAVRIFENRVRVRSGQEGNKTSFKKIVNTHYNQDVAGMFIGFYQRYRNPSAHGIQSVNYAYMRRVLHFADALLELVEDPSALKSS